jgi:hypothetical protein
MTQRTMQKRSSTRCAEKKLFQKGGGKISCKILTSMFLPRSKFAYMEETSRDERSQSERRREGQGTKPERKLYQTPRRTMELVTPFTSAAGNTPTTLLLTQPQELIFIKPKSPPGGGESKTPPGSGVKTAHEIDAQVSEGDASNSPPASVKQPPKMLKQPNLVKFALIENGEKVYGHLWEYVDDTSPEVDKYHVRINTRSEAPTPTVVTHTKLAWKHAMRHEHEISWIWKSKYTDPTGDTLPNDMFATFVVAKGTKGLSQGLATPLMTQRGGMQEGHHALTNVNKDVPEDGANEVDAAKEPAGTAARKASTLTRGVADFLIPKCHQGCP